MPDDATIALIGESTIFRGFDRPLLEWLAAGSTEHTYAHRDKIFRQGDAGGALFLVRSGIVKLQLRSFAGDVVVLSTVQAGGTFGELSLLDGGPRSASAEAVGDTALVAVPRALLLEAMAAQPRLADALLRFIGAELRRLTGQLGDASFLDLPGRVAKLLLQHARSSGGDAPTMALPLTQTELAHMVGGSRQSVNKIISMFESRGLVRVEGRRIEILQPEQLARRAAT